MFINLTNERIQQLFNKVMLEAEIKAHKVEGIVLTDLEPPDSQSCIKLLEDIIKKNIKQIVRTVEPEMEVRSGQL